MDYDEDPLDLFDDDDDGVLETILLFDEEEEKPTHPTPPQGTGCCVPFFILGSTIISAGVIIVKAYT